MLTSNIVLVYSNSIIKKKTKHSLKPTHSISRVKTNTTFCQFLQKEINCLHEIIIAY